LIVFAILCLEERKWMFVFAISKYLDVSAASIVLTSTDLILG